jgi:hypothetical protein
MRSISFLFLLAFCFSCNAQKEAITNTPKETTKETTISNVLSKPRPVAIWNISKQDHSEPNQYMLTAKLILDKGWHIFDFNPGGDGLLIAPAFSFESKDVEIIKKEMVGTLVTAKLAGMDDDVRYYENEVSFKVLIRSKKKEIKGSVYYQLCDHEKCLAPTEELFDLNY